MKIKVNGKAHRVGTSKKTGNPYDFIQLHFTAPDRGVDGLASLPVLFIGVCAMKPEAKELIIRIFILFFELLRCIPLWKIDFPVFIGKM